MTAMADGDPGTAQAARMERYYRLHADIYDATRWSFLFGRGAILRLLPPGFRPGRIVEIGCGTGHNLRLLRQRFPQASLVGCDVSAAMVAKARRNLAGLGISLHHGPHRRGLHPQPPDLILCSYCLSMVNPGWEAVVDEAVADLPPDGRFAVVDFHDTPSRLFRRWMACHHVRMEGQLLPGLEARCGAEECRIRLAYGGLWRHFLFVGRPRPHGPAPPFPSPMATPSPRRPAQPKRPVT